MQPLFVLLLSLQAHGWPADDAWQALEAGGAVVEDVAGDQLGAVELDVFGDQNDPALAWYAGSQTVSLRVQLSSDPTVGPDLVDAVFVWLIDLDGDDLLDVAVGSEGAAGSLTAWVLDGSPGLQPAGWVVEGVYGDLAGGQVRAIAGTAGWFVDVELDRGDLLGLGISPDTPLQLSVVTGTAVDAPWSDSARCQGVCADVGAALADAVFIDQDRDGRSDVEEHQVGSDPTDADSDDDGLLDGEEFEGDTDGGGSPDSLDCDSDNDGIVDSIESGLTGLNLHPDTDAGAGCFEPDADPTEGTDPVVVDTDGGGLADGTEDWNRNGALDPPWETDPANPVDDLDTDGDGIADVLEAAAPDGLVDDVDSDGDGVPDDMELLYDPDQDGIPAFLDDDSDGDGIPDVIEGTADTDGGGAPDFRDSDSDNDGIPDLIEGADDPDQDGLGNWVDLDSDGDGVDDRDEGEADTDADGVPDRLDDDSDGDGIPDAVERASDVDEDGLPNFQDLDSDGDGIPDEVETAEDFDEDGDANYRDEDSDGDGKSDASEGVEDIDCDGAPNFLDADDEDSFCDPSQDAPGVEPGAGASGKDDDFDPGAGSWTGGSCSTTGAGSASWLVLGGLAWLARRRRALWLLAAPSAAFGQDVNAQRFAPVADGGALVGSFDGDVGESGAGGVALWLSWMDDPLVFRTGDGDEVAVLDDVATAGLQGHYGLGPVRLGMDLPVHVATQGLVEHRTNLGDGRISAETGLVQGDEADVALWTELSLPTGAGAAWLGDRSARLSVGAAAGLTVGKVVLVGNIGGRTGTGSRLGGLTVGPAVLSGLGACWHLTDEVGLSLEVDREDWLGNRDELGAHPTEWLAAFQARSAESARFTLGVGSGLTPGLGAPDIRVVSGLSILWSRG